MRCSILPVSAAQYPVVPRGASSVPAVPGSPRRSRVARGAVSRQARVARGAVSRQARVARGAVSRQARVARGAVSRQARVARGAVSRQARVARGAVTRQARVTRGAEPAAVPPTRPFHLASSAVLPRVCFAVYPAGPTQSARERPPPFAYSIGLGGRSAELRAS